MKRVLAVVCVLGLISTTNPTASFSEENQTAKTASAKPAETESAENSRSSSAEAAKLPVRRVVLYKNGVGYFEHLGKVRGNQDVHIDFTSAQLNDVLKSLTVLDLSGGRITGVDYNSEAPLARRLSTLRLALGQKPTVAEFLGALRGTRIEVRSGAGVAVAGRLLSVERKTRTGTGAGWTVETDEISLVSDSGEVRTVDLNPNTSVRIAERDLNTEVGKYLNLIASAREQDVRRMTVSTTGTGERNLYVSYISEVPIWKTTYRIVLPSKENKRPLVQGWAIVDNTVGEDWNDVELSLVAGAPHSFIQQLSEPYYGRRPVVPLPESVQLSPQTHAATLSRGNGTLSGTVTDASGAAIGNAKVQLKDSNGNIVAETTSDEDGEYEFSGLASGTYKIDFNGAGFNRNSYSLLSIAPGVNSLNTTLQVGSAAESVEVTANGVNLATNSASIAATNSSFGKMAAYNKLYGAASGIAGGPGGSQVMALPLPAKGVVENSIASMNSNANGQELGDLFEYKLKDRVTLRKNQSALVPVVQTEMDAEKVSVWSGTTGSGRPLRALWIKNTSPLTLDGGSFSVLESEVFAGEGLTDAIKPGEKRLISYATDLGLLVNAIQTSAPQRVTRIKIQKGVMTQITEEKQQTIYTVRNQGNVAADLIVEHPARPFWTLAKTTTEPEERSPETLRFRLHVAPNASASLPVDESHALSNTYQLSSLDDNQVTYFLQQGTLTPEMAQALQKITAQKAVVAKLEQEMEDRQKDIDRIVDDQGRLRENMKALKGSAEEKALLQRYTRQLDEQETQLAALRKKIQDTEAQRDAADEQLESMIAALDMETAK